MTVALFGEIVWGGLVEQTLLSTLQDFESNYLREMEAQAGLDPNTLDPIYSYNIASEFDRWPEEGLPSVTIVSPGTVNDPARQGSGEVQATWEFTIHVSVVADEEAEARRNGQLYIAAIRAIIMQHRSLGDEMAATAWSEERYTTIEAEDRRSLFGASASFNITREQVLDTSKGPRVPTETTDPGTVEAVVLEVEKEAIS